MAKSNKTDSESKNALIKLVKNLIPGKHNTIPLSLPVAQALGGDLESAIIFSQCMYWSERTDDPDGYFYKCYDEWYEETTIKERTCRDRIKKLESRGWIHTLILHVHNVPKLHIRVLTDNFIEDLIESQEEIAKEAEERAEKKKVDLRNRREKRKESSNPCKSTIRQNLPDNSGKNCRIATAEFAGSIDTKTTSKNYIPEITEYTKSVSKENACTTGKESGNLANEKGEQHGLVGSPKSHPDRHGAGETYGTQAETDPYAKPWNKHDRLREDEYGYAVLPPANKHKMPRQTAVRLAQYILLAAVDDSFEIALPPPGQTECAVDTKNNYGTCEENEALGLEPLRMLRSVYESQGHSDFNDILNDCWRASVSFWEEDDALSAFKSLPIPEIFEDFLEDYDVDIHPYDPDEWG